MTDCIPADWAETTLGEIRVDHSRNVDPRSEPQQVFELYSIPSFAGNRPDIVKGSEVGSTKKTLVPGTVVVSKINPRINRVWVVGAYTDYPKIGSGEWIPFFPVDGIVPGFLAFYMRQSEFREYLATRASGVGGSLMRVKPSTLADYPFAFPSEAHQHRIVEAIESYLTRLDDAVASLERVQRNLERYRASVLKAAVEGRLVPTEAELARREGRDYEPASVLLRRILAERKTRWIEDAAQKARAKAEAKALKAGNPWTPEDNVKALAKARGVAEAKYREPTSADTTDLPNLPEGWCWSAVESLSTKVADGVHKKPSYVDEGIPFVTVKNLTAGPGIDFRDLNYVSQEDHLAFSRRAGVDGGDILISKDGTLGVVRAVRTQEQFSIFVSVALVKPVDRSMTDFLELAFQAPTVQRQMVPKGSGLQHIHLEDLRKDCIPTPPLPEQARILSKASQLLPLISRVDAAVGLQLKRAGRLRQSVLKWAFEGKLVEQDPDDEPASVLLERIRAEREAAPKARRKRKKT